MKPKTKPMQNRSKQNRSVCVMPFLEKNKNKKPTNIIINGYRIFLIKNYSFLNYKNQKKGTEEKLLINKSCMKM